MAMFLSMLIFALALFGLYTLVSKVVKFVKRCLYIKKMKQKQKSGEVSREDMTKEIFARIMDEVNGGASIHK